MKPLAGVAHGLSDNLLTRAADVTLKERRRLVLMVRETPFNLAHLRNMTAVTEMGGIVFPPLPAFYLKPASIDELVGAPEAVVIHEGKNSLPFFCEFQKRFVRRADGSVQGYNHNSGLVAAFAGPGHYTARQHDAHEVWIDYTRLPADAPAAFPALIDNDGGTRRLLFGGMVDRLRKVGETFTIGLAPRHGPPMSAWFMPTPPPAPGG